MLDNKLFDAEKLSIVEFKLLKGQVEASENFVVENTKDYKIDNHLELAFNLDEKLAKADFIVDITANSKESREEAKANFHFVYFFKVDNLNELAIINDKNLMDVNSALANALSSISYSTSRGILLTRLQGTPLQGFILPVINPNSLITPTNTN